MDTPETRLAVLENEVKNVKDEVKDTKALVTGIDKKLDGLAQNFASREDLRTYKQTQDKAMVTVQSQIDEINKRKQLKENLLWLGIIASSILNVVMVYATFTK